MDHDGKLELRRQLQMLAEERSLGGSRRGVAVQLQPRFPGRGRQRIREHGLQLAKAACVLVGCLVRVDAEDTSDAVVLSCDLERRETGVDTRADGEETVHSRGACAV